MSATVAALYNAGIALYECDEASGNLVDLLGNYDLAQTGTIVSATGVRGSARQWPATSGTRYFANASFTHNVLKNGGGASAEWFASFFMHIDSMPASFANRRILGNTSATTGDFFFELNGSNPATMFLRTRSPSNDFTAGASGITAGTWYHVVGGYNGTRYWLTVGTTSAPSWSSRDISLTDVTPDSTSLAVPLRIGAYHNSNDSLRGFTLDQINFFSGGPGDIGTEQDVIDALYGGGNGINWDDRLSGGSGMGSMGGSGLGLGLGLD